MEIAKRKQDDKLIISLNGRLDANTAGSLEQELVPLIKAGETKIVLDMDMLEYISSAGLRVLLMCMKMLRKQEGTMTLARMKDFIKEVFDIAGFTPIFEIVDSVEDV
ncbi:MAG: anti-anti-sigma factor [Candidatus Cloacimonas sp. 4484_143]|nr:MAG: anti-anti-sigma factor [Candidatus Cloacimonas sp. 4484_143]RLC50418.1 MAG: anti-anti-sigma factor [Candidatus Cloacimonadota bacterium]RLC57988.1 MAG: anti-anti-sigma factor [Candidatus Cloacimonadota bacterium]